MIMVRFLLQRPIAVLMAFTACFLVGLVSYFALPISLLPDIAIPEIVVQVSGENTSARELENTVVKPIRQQLMQVTNIRDIHSETRDGAGIIRLSFDYGTNTDLAFIEVNEKIDAAMNHLPKEVERPRVVKASATDIPVFYLNLVVKDGKDAKSETFLKLCEFAENVVKRRIEQLSEVAMVDITGLVEQQVQIIPDMNKLELSGLTLEALEQVLEEYNVTPGSMVVRDGYYEYNVKFPTVLRTVDDIREIYLRQGGRLFQLKDFATVEIVPSRESGLSLVQGKRAVTLAVIKQADENMADLKDVLGEVTDLFARQYPDIDFLITQDQTELLDYTLENLKQNLLLGLLFICIVTVFFLGDVKSPLVIGLSMLVSIVSSFVFFYLFHMSLNIISLSGLILALGMMIDSSIIVTENISQYRLNGDSLETACVRGTTEVITPMLSSTLTTIVVFLPLVFMSGIAGAIFYDQAFSVTVSLLVSYCTGIMLLPVLYKLVYAIPDEKAHWLGRYFKNIVKTSSIIRFYDWGADWVFSHKRVVTIGTILTFPLCIWLFREIPKTRMPEIDQTELLVHVEWNENIHLEENERRVKDLFRETSSLIPDLIYTSHVGRQQFLLNKERELSVSEAEFYFKVPKTRDIPVLQKQIEERLAETCPVAVASFSPPVTIFERLFVTGEADLVAELYPRNKETRITPEEVSRLSTLFRSETGKSPTGVAFDRQLDLQIDRRKLLLYGVDYQEVSRILKTAFKENEVSTLRSFQQYYPINLTGQEQTVEEILCNTLVSLPETEGKENRYVPLRELVSVMPSEDLKSIVAGKDGEYVPFSFYGLDDPETTLAALSDIRSEEKLGGEWEMDFSGSFFSNRQMLGELVVILFISLLLMYFILASQFESFIQPLIVLLEIPIDVAAALLVLWLCGHTLNLMSAIGIVVTCGVIINDSILKLDVINELRKAGTPLLEAIHEAGHRRLRPILMTSLTTIFGMVPLLFSFDLGSELQKPLSIAMIAAMFFGTAVSLFVIPLAYWFIYKNKKEVTHPNRETHD